MKTFPKSLVLSVAAALVAIAGATQALANEALQFNAAGLLVAPNGMTLYTFDKDAPNKSNCAGGCLAAWPAWVAKDAAALKAPLAAITREDGSRQVTLNGKPLYFYVADQKAGDATGDNSGGVWHVVRKDTAKTSAAPATTSSYTY